jgi:hypothetical protein
MNKKITVQPNQSVYDIAIQEYGSVEGVFLLMQDNPLIITSLDVNLIMGTRLQILSLPLNKEIISYYKDNHIIPVSSIDALSVAGGGDFSIDFNKDYL